MTHDHLAEKHIPNIWPVTRGLSNKPHWAYGAWLCNYPWLAPPVLPFIASLIRGKPGWQLRAMASEEKHCWVRINLQWNMLKRHKTPLKEKLSMSLLSFITVTLMPRCFSLQEDRLLHHICCDGWTCCNSYDSVNKTCWYQIKEDGREGVQLTSCSCLLLSVTPPQFFLNDLCMRLKKLINASYLMYKFN